MASPQVWFITGCSSGFGAGLAKIALKAGHKVIASSRNPSKTPELVQEIESLGGTWLQFDVNSKDLTKILDKAVGIYGPIDVLVNNAGYSLIGSLEDISDEEARAQFDTNVFAPLSIIRHILPSMRERKTGTIVNVSSIAGIDALPSSGLYAGSKHALEGISESLSRDVAAFNIRVLIVEPGAFRSQFLANFVPAQKGVHPGYAGTPVDLTLEKFKQMAGNQRGDVQKGSQAIYDAVARAGPFTALEPPLRLPIGPDAAQRIKVHAESLLETLDVLQPVWSSTDIEA